MLGLALFFALALDSCRARGSKAHPPARSSCRMPCPPSSRRSCGATSTAPTSARSPRCRGRSGFGTPDFLSAENMLGSMMNIVTWEFVGYNMIIMYAALRSIPAELYEAAEIDGAGQFRLAWSIKIPAIRPAILLTMIFSIIGVVPALRRAEPAVNAIAPNVIDNSYTPNYYAYNLAFVNQELNYAAAIAFLLGIVIAVLSYFVQLGSQRRERRETETAHDLHRDPRGRDRRRRDRRRAGRAATTTRAAPQPAAHRAALALRAVLRAAAVVAARLLDEGQRRAVLDVRPVVRRRTSRSGRTCRRCSACATASSRAGW